MKRLVFNLSVSLILSLITMCAVASAQSNDSHKPLNNAAIVKLVKAGFKEKSIITIIGTRPADFDLSTDRMIELKRNGVSEKVILAMISRQQGGEFSDEAWNDDEFFNFPSGSSASSKDGAKQSNPNDGSSADIFGSGTSSRGSTRSRGGANGGVNGDVSGDTITTGSATVRILRPPTDTNGSSGTGPAKLEKTPSLNNDAVIELVEAGFSDGTIIRRIEQSPVNFDFAPEKLADLKKHRVSDKIVSAMKTAMGVDNGNSNTPTSSGTPKQ